VKRGYLVVDFIKRDPELAPLRSLEAFQTHLMDLSFPDDPFLP
jgi:hypothetical protein